MQRSSRASSDDALQRAETNPLERHRLEPFVQWLESVASALSSAGSLPDLMMCERLLAELRKTMADPQSQPTMGAYGVEIRACLGGMRSIVRALSCGQLPLDRALRTELIDLVRDISEALITHDLGG